jgi:protoporphyrinogen/coproporphyrinogen III oxidase
VSRSAIVVGAGLAGTAAAYTLNRAGWKVRIIERNDYVGGRANTVAKQGYLIDTAASGVASTHTAYLELAREVGFASRILPASSIIGLLRDDRIHEIDMRRPAHSGLRTKLLSLRAKLSLLKLLRDVFRAKRRGMLNRSDPGQAAPLDNESVASYAMRVLSREANDYFCDPIARVMLLTDGDRVSKVDFFSSIANVLQAQMLSLQGGQQSLPMRLAEGIPVALESNVTLVRSKDTAVTVSWIGARNGDSGSEKVDAAVLACDLHTTTVICPEHRAWLQPLQGRLNYTRAISVCIGASALTRTRSVIVFVPSREEGNIATLFLEHNKSADRAPAGHSLITAYFEASACEAHWEQDNMSIADMALSYVLRVFPELRGHVAMTHVKRWSPALPLMTIGGYGEIAKLHERLDPASRIQVCGDYLSGAGQGAAVDFGIRAARNLIAQ